LIKAVDPSLDIRIGQISHYNEKGIHTTTSARRYILDLEAEVIDTPGIKQFGLVNVDQDSLLQYFPDIDDETAPDWRRESYERIRQSL